MYGLQHAIHMEGKQVKDKPSALSDNTERGFEDNPLLDYISKKDALGGLVKAILYVESHPCYKAINTDYLWDIYECIKDCEEPGSGDDGLVEG